MSDWKIYHNPRCSKSRQTLALLRENGVEPEVIEYLNTPPSAEEIEEIMEMFSAEPHLLVRTKEEEYRKDPFSLKSKKEIARHLAEKPALMERPLVVHQGKAVLGRPPENVKVLL
jgi:arsenate reductase